MTQMETGPDLQVGDSGEWVSHLQERLRALFLYEGAVDGNYGEETDAAVRQLCEHAGMSHEGGVSTQIWQVLLEQEHAAGIGGAAAGEAEQAASAGPAVGELSEDGQWQWDGQEWKAAGEAAASAGAASAESTEDGAQGIQAGQLSEDGQWRWDGTEWKPAAEGNGAATEAAHAETAGAEGAQSAEGDKRQIAVNQEADDPTTDEAQLVEA